jgi:2-polyprenyl-3-methyl-5-hydroxy-6-metoxy-1,4-benzoquinol methylase
MNDPGSGEDDPATLKRLEREGRDTGATGQPLWYHAESDLRHAIELRIYLHHLAPKKHERVLDAGCGMGRIAIEVASRVSSLTCIDFAFVPLKVLCQRQR